MRAIRGLAVLRRALLLRLTAGNERWQPFDVSVAFRHLRLRARLKVLRLVLRLRLLRRLMRLVVLRLLMLRLLMLRLMVLRLALVERLHLRRIGLAHLRLIIAVIVAVVGHIAAHSTARLLLLKIGLVLAKLFLRGGDQTKIMFGVLIIIFRGNRIS